MKFFPEPNFEYSLTQITKKLKISIGSAQRITNSLITIGYLAKDKKTKKFRLTPKWLPIGFGIRGGALAISVPILNHNGRAIAGINIGTPSNAPPDEKKFKEYVQLLMNTGAAISSEIGYMDYMGE